MEQEVHFVDTLVQVPMPTEPCFVVYHLFNFVKPVFGACINHALVDIRKEHLYRLVFERTGMGENHIDIV